MHFRGPLLARPVCPSGWPRLLANLGERSESEAVCRVPLLARPAVCLSDTGVAEVEHREHQNPSAGGPVENVTQRKRKHPAANERSRVLAIYNRLVSCETSL